jgi:hypothetical protein
MIIVWSVRYDYIGIPFADLPDNLKSHFQAGHQFTIVIIQYIILNAKSFTGFFCFGNSSLGKRTTAFGLMAGIAIGNRYKLHGMPHRGKEYGCTATITIAVIRVGAYHDDP